MKTHWRDASRTPKLFIMDAYAAFPLLLFTLHIRWWTFILALISMAFFGTLERFGYTLPVFKRLVKQFLAGKVIQAQPWFTRQ